MVQAAHFHFWRIAQLHPYLDMGALMTLIHALVISRIHYCSALYVRLPLRLMWRLQLVQKFGSQINNWGEEIPTHLPHFAHPSLATGSFPHQLQGYDDNIQSSK